MKLTTKSILHKTISYNEVIWCLRLLYVLHFKGNDLYASTTLVQMCNQSIMYIRSSSNVSGFMQLSPPTKLVDCLELLRDQEGEL
jgi:hypothetical protein